MIGFQNITDNVKVKPIWLYGLMSFALMSCASTVETSEVQGNDGISVDSSRASNNISYLSDTEEVTTIFVKQIGTTAPTLKTPQILENYDVKQFTVEQLLVYADRCSHDAISPPPKGLDCSELNLRIKRIQGANDIIINALNTLDGFGRTNDDLENVGPEPDSDLNIVTIISPQR